MRPLTAALLFQGGLIVLAVLLAWVFGLAPWTELTVSVSALVVALVATLPLAGALLLAVPNSRWRWASELVELVGDFVHTLFANAWPGAVVVVSALAGIGEELLFRGVIQDGLAQLWSPAAGLAVASLLFGAAHALSPGYWLLATLMGLYLGLLYHCSGNLLLPMLVHALYDWLAIHFYLRRR